MRAAQRIRSLVAAAMFVLALPAGSVMGSDEPDIQVAVGTDELFIGESVEFQVDIRNAKNPTAPDLSALKSDFEVVAAGDESRNQSTTTIINGRVTKHSFIGHTYHYRLTPRKTGQVTIPPVTASIDGKTVKSEALTINVDEIQKQDLVLIELEADHETVYPTQPFTVTLRILIQPMPKSSPDRDPLSPLRWQLPHLQINWLDIPPGLVAEEKSRWLQPMLSSDGMGFHLNDLTTRSGFLSDSARAVFSLPKHRETRKGLNGQSIRYFVYELSRTFTPERIGEFNFGPATIKGQFVALSDDNNVTGRRIFNSTEAITVEVRNLPTPRPATYCGAIGDYKVRTSASPVRLRVGDPMTLTVEIERSSQSGPLEMISAPDLSSIPELNDDFDLIDKNPTGRVEGMLKKFTYALRPKRIGATIPALTLHTFDPVKEVYTPIQSKPIPLEVTEATQMSDSDIVGANPTKGAPDIKSRAQGIFQNITDLREVYDQRVNVTLWTALTIGAWCVAGALLLALTYHRHKTSDATWVRRKQARPAATERLVAARTAATAGQALESLRLVRLALIGYVADTRNLIADGLTTSDVGVQLTAASVPAIDRTAYLELLESIESAEYGAIRSVEPSTIIDSATQLIERLSASLERSQ